MTENTGSFADKLNGLFETKTQPDGTRYTQEELIRASGGALTRVYLWKLRTGRATNPGLSVVKAIADFFEVGVDYFFEEQPKKAATHTDVVEELSKNGMATQIALRSTKLDAEGKKKVLEMIDYILSLSGKGESAENPDSKGDQEK